MRGNFCPRDLRRIRRIFACLPVVFSIFFISALASAQDFNVTPLGDYDDISVMEVDGNYDAESADGSTNSLPRQEIAKEFFKTHPDTYDFLVIFSNFDFQMPQAEAIAFYHGVQNDVQGIGESIFDNTSLYGSAGKLQGTIDMGNIANNVSDPLDPRFSNTLGTLSHELLHRWAAFVKFKEAGGGASSALLGKDGAHWSFLLDTKGSLEYGNRWVENGDGTFTALAGRKYYSPLDLYLMGFLDKSEVPPMLLIDNPDVDPKRISEPGVTITGIPRQVTIEDIIAAEGERIPAAAESQKEFKIGCIYITRPGTFHEDQLFAVRTIIGQWPVWFSSLTDGKGIVYFDASAVADLPTNPGPGSPTSDPRTAPPEVHDGVAWLMGNQAAEGNWSDSPLTAQRDTAESLSALARFSTATQNYEAGLQWFSDKGFANLDYLARKVEVLSQSGVDAAGLTAELVSWQNSDGGWGSGKKYLSNPTDASFALKSLAAAGYADAGVVNSAINYLKNSQRADGGWGTGETGTILATVNVLTALNVYEEQSYDVADAVDKATQWLLAKQNPDGGFGNSPSTVYNTAEALLALKQLSVASSVTDNALTYLQNLQSENGSWYNSAFQTALAVKAVWTATKDPDFSVSPGDITFDPATVTRLPQSVTLAADIQNNGLVAIDSAKVVLYEGAVADANRIGEQIISVAGESSTTISFELTVTDGESHRYYLVVDPENVVPEASETNNTALKVLYPDSTFDFAILSGDVTVTPSTVNAFQDVTTSVTVRNYGTRDAYNVPLLFYLDDPDGVIAIRTVNVNIPAGGALSREITWEANRVGDNLKVSVAADPNNSFAELSEANNAAFALLTVNALTDPNLVVSHQDITVSPSPALQAGSASIAAVVKNDGFSAAENVEVRFYLGTPGVDGVLLGSGNVAVLNAGASQAVSFEWLNIDAFGERVVTVQADPGNSVQEIREDDNSGFITVQILTLPDLAVAATSIAFAPSAPKEGDTVAIRVTVQNVGEQEASNVEAVAYEGDTLIGTESIAVIPGNSSGTATFSYDTLDKPGAHNIRVEIDPQNNIQEQSEANNSASRDFSVQNADLWVSERYISPNGDGIKDNTEFFFRLEAVRTVTVNIVNAKGEVVRTYGGDYLENTLGETIAWDGLDENGMVVPDGDYLFRVVDGNGSVLASLPVTVDNNRSPLTEAIGTDYLLQKNLTCMLPEIGYKNYDGTWPWQWFSDESGIMFQIARLSETEYQPGLYTMGAGGEDILRLLPASWTEDATYKYNFTFGPQLAVSPDERKVAFILTKYNKITRKNELTQLWAVDRYGENLTLLDSYAIPKGEIYFTSERLTDLVVGRWSPDGSHFAYFRYDSNVYESNKFCVVKADGTSKAEAYVYAVENGASIFWSPDGSKVAVTAGINIDSGYRNGLFIYSPDGKHLAEAPVGDLRWNTFVEWAPDSSKVIYVTNIWDYDKDDQYSQARSLRPNGEQELFFETLDRLEYNTYQLYKTQDISPLGDKTIIVRELDYDTYDNNIRILDTSGAGKHRTYTQVTDLYISGGYGGYWDSCEDYAPRPGGGAVAYADCTDDSGSLKICDDQGNCKDYDPEPPVPGAWGAPFDIRWSPDGRKVAFVSPLPFSGDESFSSTLNYLVVIDTQTGKKKLLSLGYSLRNAEEQLFSSDFAAISKPEPEGNGYLEGSLQWLGDSVSLMGKDETGIFVVNSEDGEKAYLPTETYIYDDDEIRVSPLGNYITYSTYTDWNSVCYGQGYRDMWSISSLLNLTADLRAVKNKSVVLLKGIAADRNFAGYTLEYADTNSPEDWNLIEPPSDTPLVNDDFTTWIPPYEGTFLVRLTVTDKAGNSAWDRERVSWGLASSITNIYRTENIFSPNDDGVKDSVNLHYTVTEPVHLEFSVYDAEGTLVRTFLKDHSVAEVDFVTWDGRDSSGRVVPDGEYTIKVFDYAFKFVVDNTPPDVSIGLDGITPGFSLSSSLQGWVTDTALKGWIIEYGEGENPQAWHEYAGGGDQISPEMLYGKIVPATIALLSGDALLFAVGRKYRLTAEDSAGNVASAGTDFLEQVLLAYRWDGGEIRLDRQGQGEWESVAIPLDEARPGIHTIRAAETYRAPFVSANIQYRKGMQWFDAPDVEASFSGETDIVWDSSQFNPEEVAAVRVKAVDALNREIFSNTVPIGPPSFVIGTCYDPKTSLKYIGKVNISLAEDLVSQKFQYRGRGETAWRDWYEVSQGNIPSDSFYPGPVFGEDPVEIRMIGIGVSGKKYISNLAVSPTEVRCTPPPSGGGGGGGVGGGINQPSAPPELAMNILYDEGVECGATMPDTVTVSSEAKRTAASLFRTLSYYLDGDGASSLLRTYDLASEGWGDAVLDTTVLPEGRYTVRALLEYEKDGAPKSLVGQGHLLVDRVAPVAELGVLCPGVFEDITGQWQGVRVEGVASDDREVRKYALYYGFGENSTKWKPALGRNGLPITGGTAKNGVLGIWDASRLGWDTYTLLLKVVDQVGNVSCTTKLFTINKTGSLHAVLDTMLFSPNNDGKYDRVEVGYTFGRQATIEVRVFKRETEELVRHVLTTQYESGQETTFWDGTNDSGIPVADGKYIIRVLATDSCGGKEQQDLVVEVDNTPPTAAITAPQPGDVFGVVAEVKGSVEDKNFSSYQLEAVQASAPDTPLSLASDSSPRTDAALGNWNTHGLEGIWLLKLTATDQVGNRSETTQSFTLTPRDDLIKSLEVVPDIFSPNNDGKRDTAEVRYEVTETSNVTMEMFDEGGALKETATFDAVPPGPRTFIWQGRDANGPYPDGGYQVKLTAVLTADPSVTQQESAGVVIDTIPPVIEMTAPLDQAFIKDTLSIRGSITDLHLRDYSVSYDGAGGLVPVDQASQTRENYDFGAFPDITDGLYTLRVLAYDRAENSTELASAFTVDKTAPQVLLKAPEDGALFGNQTAMIALRGVIEETNLAQYTLRYGAGENPGQWTELTGGNALPTGEDLFGWDVSSASGVADGTYTISLSALDKAGWEAETHITVVVDNTPPTAIITTPATGSYVTEPDDVLGTAQDRNLDQFTLAVSAGECATAYKWETMTEKSSGVVDGTLGNWKVLPTDGVYCLKLHAADKVGQETEQRVDVIVDTKPPGAPVLSGEVVDKLDASLSWTRNSEPDLAGYNLYRNGKKVNAALLADIRYLDQNLQEGEYPYTVTAVDLAGWESEPSNEVKLRIDVTGPDVRIASPQDQATVSDLVTIKGTAYSADDFREYRVYIGRGGGTIDWLQIRRSPVPIPYGDLATWDTIGLAASQYFIKLEAEDLTGNISSHIVEVHIDNEPPAAPVLLSATPLDSDVDLVWQANSEPDIAGYLLYRNNQLANVPGAVSGDLSPYLIVGTEYTDADLPDGTFVYSLEAMDTAGNTSEQSNSIEVTIDTHPPQALIVDPANGHRFEHPLAVKAESVDLDVASVLFQYKNTADSVWSDLETVTTLPFVTHFDPGGMGLPYADYQLRAVATDRAGKVDPFPQAITVTYTDLTPPAPPTGLSALADGGQVAVNWNGNTENDLDGYNLYKVEGKYKVLLNSELLHTVNFLHQGAGGNPDLADGEYTYEVTAVDTHGNESKPSAPASAIVYAPVLVQPYSPVVDLQTNVTGTAAAGATVELFVENAAGATTVGTVVADAQGGFAIQAPLARGENRFTAKAADSAGNVSKVSNMVVVVSSEPPSVPTGLSVAVNGFEATPSWNANPEPDILGYVLTRNGKKVVASTRAASGTTSASQMDYYASRAFDNNPDTYWYFYYYSDVSLPVWWQVDLPEQALISRLEIEWGADGKALYAGRDFEVQVWNGYGWVTKEKVAGNSEQVNAFEWGPAYRTNKVRVYITEATTPPAGYSKNVRIAEVRITQEHPLAATSYVDAGLADGEYAYQVAAVNEYGFVSQSAEAVPATIGDVVPPQAPLDLTAAPSGSDALLAWLANSEPDLAGYNVYRQEGLNWTKLNAALVPDTTYRDSGLLNGSYTYRVTAVDGVGNESAPSNEAEAVILIDAPLAPPNLVIEAPAEGDSLRLAWDTVPSAVGYNLYRGATAGGPYAKVNTTPLAVTSYLDTGVANGTTYYYVAVATDLVGNESPYSNEVFGTPQKTTIPEKPVIFTPTISGVPLAVNTETVDIVGWAEPGSRVEIFSGEVSRGTTGATGESVSQTFAPQNYIVGAAVSPDGGRLAYHTWSWLYVRDLATGEETEIASRGNSPHWSRDGRSLAYVYRDSNWNERVAVYDFDTGSATDVTDDQWVDEAFPSWTADGNKLFFVSDRGGNNSIWLKDIASGEMTNILADVYPDDLACSPDGSSVAYLESGVLFVVDVATQTVRELADFVLGPQGAGPAFGWSPDSDWIVYGTAQSGSVDMYVVDAASGESSPVAASASDGALFRWAPDGRQLVYFKRAEGEIWTAPVGAQGEHLLLDTVDPYSILSLDWVPSGGIFYASGSIVHMYQPEGLFILQDVPLAIGENIFQATATDPSENVSPPSDPVSVSLNASLFPDLEVLASDLQVSPAAPIVGDTAAMSVIVRNNSGVSARDVDVDLFVWESGGNVVRLHAETVPVMNAWEEKVVELPWDTTGKVGENTLMAFVDIDGKIQEPVETNNFASKSFYVAAEEGIGMDAALDGEVYHENEYVSIDIDLHNSGIAKDVELDVAVVDEAGTEVTAFETLKTELAYGGVESYFLAWDTGSTFAGNYGVRAVLTDSAGNLMEQRTLPFSIAPTILVQPALVTDKMHYGANEEVRMRVDLANLGGNYNIPALTVKLRVADAAADLFEESIAVANLSAGASATVGSSWNTGMHAPGPHSVTAEIIHDNEVLSVLTAPITIDGSSELSGLVKATPAVVLYGSGVRIDRTVRLSGNLPAQDVLATVSVQDPRTGEVVGTSAQSISLDLGESSSASIDFTGSGLALGTYNVFLRATYQGKTMTLDTTSFVVKDVMPPTVEILSPDHGSTWNGPVALSVRAVDDASGVKSAEYRIDQGAWLPMPAVDPSSGRYAFTWEPTENDEGEHVLSFRATDRAGNTASPVSSTILVELTTPFEKLTGTLGVSPAAAYRGQEIRFPYTINNVSAETLGNISVRLLVIDPASGEQAYVMEQVVALPGESVYPAHFMLSSLELDPRSYRAELKIEAVDEEPRILATAPFDVLPSITGEKSAAPPASVLVWINEKCTHREDGGSWHEDDDDRDDRHDGKEHGDDGRHEHHHDRHHCGAACFDSSHCVENCARIDLLEDILAEATESYVIVYERKEFERELRNPIYSDIVILGDHKPLTDHYDEELREKVYSGTGLFVAGWKSHKLDHDDGEELFGLKVMGGLSKKYAGPVLTEPSPITDEGVIVPQGTIAKVKAEEDAVVAGWVEYAKGKDDDDHDHEDRHKKKGKECKDGKGRGEKAPDRYPAIVLHEYGLGKTVFLAFDYARTLDENTYEQMKDLLTRSLAHIHRVDDTGAYHPYQLVRIERKITSLSDDFAVRVSETNPDGVQIFDPATPQWITEFPWQLSVDVPAGGSVDLPYYALMPDREGGYRTETEIGFVLDDVYNHVDTLAVDLVVEQNTAMLLDSVIAQVEALPVSRRDEYHAGKVVKELRKAQDRIIVTAKDIEKNIRNIEKAVERLLRIKSVATHDIRLVLDRLLRIEEGEYYFFIPPIDSVTGTLEGPVPAARGDRAVFPYTLTNDQAVVFEEIDVCLTVLDPRTGKSLARARDEKRLEAESTLTEELVVKTKYLAAGTHEARLSIKGEDSEYRVLATVLFEVLEECRTGDKEKQHRGRSHR